MSGRAGWSSRRRAWVLAGCAMLLVLTYLAGWVAYCYNGLSVYGRVQQYAAGSAGSRAGVDYRLLRLTATKTLLRSEGSAGDPPPEGSSYVVAVLESTIHAKDPEQKYPCQVGLVGPDRRAYELDQLGLPTRALPQSCSSDLMTLGQPYRWEKIFTVPDADLDRIYGVKLIDSGSRGVSPILRPPR